MRAVSLTARRLLFHSGQRVVHVTRTGRPCPPVCSNRKEMAVTRTVDEDADNVTGDFCAIDATGKKMGKRTVGEMEQVYSVAQCAPLARSLLLSAMHAAHD